MAKLVIVESPAKAKTIGKYLGDDYEVTASMGQEAGCRPGHHGYSLHHHHRGCLQPDPVFPDRTAGVPQYDVKNKAMPDGLEVTARHCFFRCGKLHVSPPFPHRKTAAARC